MHSQTDLIAIVPDKNTQFVLDVALRRDKAVGMRPITYEMVVHSGRDGGVRGGGVALLATQRRQYAHALLVFDYEGCGEESTPAKDLESRLDEALSVEWGQGAKAIVVEPEMDAWMWGSDATLRDVLGWGDDRPIRDWLRQEGFAIDADGKPARPKEAIERVLRRVRKPKSSAIYAQIAERTSIARCKDPAVQRLRKHLRRWFPAK